VSSARASTAPVEVDRPSGESVTRPDRPWLVVVWNDPINLMSYVTYVFQKLFGYSYQKATKLMLDVHHKGRAVVSSGSREKAEFDTFRLHAHGLWATMQYES
jgi:ATP-dependent Clp protease adaptor protein ClpS